MRGLTKKIFRESVTRLRRGGQLILYSGSPIQSGEDLFKSYVESCLTADFSLRYSEIDPDIFGEELSTPAYARVDRIAAIGLVLTREN